MHSPNNLFSAITAAGDPEKVAVLSRFFKTAPGQYGEGDKFLGIKVPTVRSITKSLQNETTLDDLPDCITSPYHEMRLAALLSLILIFKHAKRNPAIQQECIDFYLNHTAYINNWDLVDLSCYELLGNWLLDKDRTILYRLAKDGKSIWEQRIGIVSTMQFVRHGQLDDTLAIAEILLPHAHDLIHKAVGWLLREVGKKDKTALVDFLTTHSTQMPRTTLRYAIERLPEPERLSWLKNSKKECN